MSLNPITYTAGDIATYVKRQFGDESGVQITDADIWRWLDAAQIRIVAENQPLKSKAATDVVANQKSYNLAALSIHQIESIHYDGERLPGMSFAEAERKIITDNQSFNLTGDPFFWWEWAGEITFWPVPIRDIPNGIEVYFTKMPVKITSSTDSLSVPDKYFDALVAWIMSKAYELDEEFSQASEQKNFFLQTIGVQAGEEQESENSTYNTITFVNEDY